MSAIENSAYNKDYYLKAFEENNIVEVTGRPMEDLSIIADSLIVYLKGKGGDEILTPHFNEKEIMHMKDVQVLFDYARILKYVSLGIAVAIIIYFNIIFNKKAIGKVMLFGLFANHIIVLLIGLIVATDFTKYWTIFHKIFFTNELWLLDPATDLMIQMLPESFFSGMAVKIVLSFFIYLAILQVTGLYYMKRSIKNGKVQQNFKTVSNKKGRRNS